MSETRNYRGATLEELLPQIREELGPDAVITRRREGIIGGVGGFFGKRCVEVEARSAWDIPGGSPEPAFEAPLAPAVPPQRVLDLYDSGDEPTFVDASESLLTAVEDALRDETPVEKTQPEKTQPFRIADEPTVSSLLDELLAQSSPFADTLVDAMEEPAFLDEEPQRETETVAVAEVEPEVGFEPEAEIEPQPVLEPVVVAASEPVVEPQPVTQPVEISALAEIGAGVQMGTDVLMGSDVPRRALRSLPAPEDSTPAPLALPAPLPAQAARDERKAVFAALKAALVPAALAKEVVEEAERELAPFSPGVPLASLVRRSLARRFKVRARGRVKRRTIVLIGPEGAGRSLAAAKLAVAHARAGASVCAVSLEPGSAIDLALQTQPHDVPVEAVGDPEGMKVLAARLKDHDLVVVDTPALDPADPESARRVANLLAPLKAKEVHLVLPANVDLPLARVLLSDLGADFKIDALIATHADRSQSGSAAGLSLTLGVPVSYISSSSLVLVGMTPAEPDELARMVLP